MHEDSLPKEKDEQELMPFCFNPTCRKNGVHIKIQKEKTKSGTPVYRAVCPVCGLYATISGTAYGAVRFYKELEQDLKEKIRIPSPDAVWLNADMHGWHEPSATFGENIAHIHSELSEALQAYRENGCDTEEQKRKIGEEFADVVLLVMHVCRQMEIKNIEEIITEKHLNNIGRPYRHGNKKL